MGNALDSKKIIHRLIWIDAKVNNGENKEYQKILKKNYGLDIETYETAKSGIEALEKIQFESIFVITSGTIYPSFFDYMKKTYEELRVVPFSIIFTSSKKSFLNKHKNDEIGKIYNKTFYNRGGVVDRFQGVISFIEEIYNELDNFKTCNKYKGIFTKDYSGLIVFKEVDDQDLPLPDFYRDIYKKSNIDFSELNIFTIFFLKNFCTEKIEILLKPLILFKEVPEVIISKWWARIYTHESPFYSVMNKTLMKSLYKEYEVYIKLLYKGLACNSYRPKFEKNLTRGTKLELSEIKYLKSISGTKNIIINKSFLSFSLNKKKSIEFQTNTSRGGSVIKEPVEVDVLESDVERVADEGELSVLIEIINIDESQKNNYVISNAYLKDISYYSKEEEVLLFPFTGFEVTGWELTDFKNQKNKKVLGTTFYFKFSEEYYKRIKRKYS